MKKYVDIHIKTDLKDNFSIVIGNGQPLGSGEWFGTRVYGEKWDEFEGIILNMENVEVSKLTKAIKECGFEIESIEEGAEE